MRAKALGMISGGLDSILAAKVLCRLGVEVEGIHFVTGFAKNDFSGDTAFSDSLGFPVRRVDITESFLPVVLSPRYGYGSHMNPCVDCKIHMLRRLEELLGPLGAQFVFTGEVLGQRPMSQFRSSLKRIEIDGGLPGLILRPLSASLLDPTIPETKGWVDRKGLLGFSGRSRKPQMALAKELGLEAYAQPAGGCYLADGPFSSKMKDLIAYKGKENITLDDLKLLRVGRHFRVSGHIKVVSGRNEKENERLRAFETGRHLFEVTDAPSSLVVAESRSDLGEADSLQIASIAARYSDSPSRPARVLHRYGERSQWIDSFPAAETLLAGWRI